MEQAATPFASVIVPVFEDSQRLKRCLAKLEEQDYPKDCYEVVVVDNGSEYPPTGIETEFPNCRLLHEPKPGSYAARNCGVSQAKGEVLAFTDSDCLPSTGWLSCGVRHLLAADQNHTVASVGGRIIVFPTDEDQPNAAEVFDCIFGLNQENNVRQLHFAATGNMFTTRKVFDLVGLFNSEVKSGGDIEWGQRLRGRNLRVEFARDAVVYHPARDSVRGLIRQKRRHAGGRTSADANPVSAKRVLQLTKTAMRNIIPRPCSIITILKRSEYGLWIRIKTVGLACLLHYAMYFEYLRTRLGGSVERR